MAKVLLLDDVLDAVNLMKRILKETGHEVAGFTEEGLAFAGQPSQDAQSIAGILSTDVHGTGKNWGFVSESIVKLKLLDGKGEIFECGPTDDLFRAAIGGVGAVGIILEVAV